MKGGLTQTNVLDPGFGYEIGKRIILDIDRGG
jgi:hypothetical protein